MAANLVRQRHDGGKITDGPAPRSKTCAVDHANNKGKQEQIHPLEVADNPVKTHSESRFSKFFGCGCPFDTDTEKVAEDGLEKMEGNASEE